MPQTHTCLYETFKFSIFVDAPLFISGSTELSWEKLLFGSQFFGIEYKKLWEIDNIDTKVQEVWPAAPFSSFNCWNWTEGHKWPNEILRCRKIFFLNLLESVQALFLQRFRVLASTLRDISNCWQYYVLCSCCYKIRSNIMNSLC